MLLMLPLLAFRGNGEDDLARAVKQFAANPIVQQRNCVTCHTIGGSGGTVGPILDQIGNRRGEDWLRKWLRDPQAVRPGTRMPNFRFTDEELERLVADMSRLRRSVPVKDILSRHKDPVAAGEALFAAYDCYACHRIGKTGRFIGPNLTWLGKRRSREWEERWLKNPQAVKPGTFMPNFQLSEPEVAALAAFVTSQRGQHNEEAREWESTTAFFLDARPRERGRMVAERLACWSCHGEGLDSGEANPNAAPEERVPPINTAFVDFTEDELTDIILNGRVPKRLRPEGPQPPLACPGWREALNEAELADLLAYLETIVPESAKWEFK